MIGQSVGAYTDATHGMTLSAVSLPYYRHILPYGLHQFKKFAVNVWGVRPEGKSDEAIAQAGLAAMEAWMVEMGLVLHLAELGVTPDMVEGIAKGSFVMEGGYKVLTPPGDCGHPPAEHVTPLVENHPRRGCLWQVPPGGGCLWSLMALGPPRPSAGRSGQSGTAARRAPRCQALALGGGAEVLHHGAHPFPDLEVSLPPALGHQAKEPRQADLLLGKHLRHVQEVGVPHIAAWARPIATRPAPPVPAW